MLESTSRGSFRYHVEAHIAVADRDGRSEGIAEELMEMLEYDERVLHSRFPDAMSLIAPGVGRACRAAPPT